MMGQNTQYVMQRSGRFYLEPKGRLLAKLNGRKSIPLGGSYVEMIGEYKKIMEEIEPIRSNSIHTMDQLIDRYMLEIIPTKAESGQKAEIYRCKHLKRVFGRMHPADVTKVDIYRYIDLRSKTAPTGVNREVALLSGIYRKAERWGVVKHSPCFNIEYNKEEPRKRYVTHKEYNDYQESLNDRQTIIARYIDFKYITGLRAIDIRRLTDDQFTEEGIVLIISKNGQDRLVEWTPTLKRITKELKAACRRERYDKKTKQMKWVDSEYLLYTRKGTPYTADGWRAIFYRYMRMAVKEGVLETPFCDHDIRAKGASDLPTVEEAAQFLAHSDVKVTEKHYRRRLKRIIPLL